MGIESYIPLRKGSRILRCFESKSATAFYKSHKIDLITGIKSTSNLSDLQTSLESYSFESKYEKPTIIHCFFEWGYFYKELEPLIQEDDLLAIIIDYNRYEEGSFEDFVSKSSGSFSILSYPENKSYDSAFGMIQKHLEKGDCYQANLTFKYEGSVSTKKTCELLGLLWKEGQTSSYAHASIIPLLGKAYISNSPECLFQVKRGEKGFYAWSMPIKGSAELEEKKNWRARWDELDSSIKNKAELDIITDLIRNDLSSIEKPTAKVKKRAAPLIVPKILHQFSIVSNWFSFDVNLGKLLRGIFPGGSVTGAPKKRVLQILNEVEGGTRGFYCGSSIFLFKDILAASINIRSSEVDTETFEVRYHSGGGITLLSNADDEYQEMILKVESVLGEFSTF